MSANNKPTTDICTLFTLIVVGLFRKCTANSGEPEQKELSNDTHCID